MAINRTQLAALIGPFVPDADAMLLQIPDVRLAGQKPQQLVDDRFQMQLLGRDQGKAFIQLKPHLMAKYRQRSGSGAVAFLDPTVEDEFHQVKILAHLFEYRLATEDGEVYRREQRLAAVFQPPKCQPSRSTPDTIAPVQLGVCK